MKAEVVLAGLHVPEGPAVLPDGRIAFTEQTAGRISVLEGAAAVPLVHTGGAANSCAVGADGLLYVCQNGGVVGDWRSPHPVTPAIQRARPGAADRPVETLAVEAAGMPLVAPNDLAFGPDGRLFFTDPAQPFRPAQPAPAGRIFALDPGRDDPSELVADVGGVYCNGIGFTGDGRLLWVESYTRRVCTLRPDGPRVLATLPQGHVPDGFAVAADGRIFIASCESHGITVLGPDGRYLGLIPLDAGANPTNCCFQGSSLWVTDFGMDWATRPGAGRLWRIETDAVGAPGAPGALG
ncbi:SMP-30/gluconolactonase/LRE family protein [Actinoplanes sp. URMC 104]|uniref:SMP-30/gluconolactonase/LRE family protein n=1 Tax=Actinoplanes sp. URMC 104 TaxID=3423409 RepID=UPI003F1E1A86